MASYETLAGLRRDLNSDDRAVMYDAMTAVREAGLRPGPVLSEDPPVEELVEAGLIPESEETMTAGEHRRQVRELLARIAENTGGS